MARTEGYSEGTYSSANIKSRYKLWFCRSKYYLRKIGVKVWIYKGEVFPTKNGVNPREERRNDRRDNKRK